MSPAPLCLEPHPSVVHLQGALSIHPSIPDPCPSIHCLSLIPLSLHSSIPCVLSLYQAISKPCPSVPPSPELCPSVPPSTGCSRVGWRWSACASGTFTTTTTPSAACGMPAARSPPRTSARAWPVATDPWHLPVPHHHGHRAPLPAQGAPNTRRGFPGEGVAGRAVVSAGGFFLRV